jgi:hypothetical protein
VAPTVRQGQAIQLVAEPVGANGASVAGCVPLTYVSETPTAATISGSDGLIIGGSPGQTWLLVTANASLVQRVLLRVALPNGVRYGEDAFVGGEGHMCALSRASAAYCWGSNTDGQIGNGTRTPSFVSTPVSGEHAFVDLDLTRCCGRPTRPSFGAEVAHGIEQEGRSA